MEKKEEMEGRKGKKGERAILPFSLPPSSPV
jgi:hypothetical protein